MRVYVAACITIVVDVSIKMCMVVNTFFKKTPTKNVSFCYNDVNIPANKIYVYIFYDLLTFKILENK